MNSPKTQAEQIINLVRNNGGFATLRRINELADFSTWKTKTPEASVRRIVQNSKAFFKIKPGLWALEECREKVLRNFNLSLGDNKSEEKFTHGYYQGLLVELGHIKNFTTYIPAQDKNRMFLDRPLADIADITSIPPFTFEKLLKRAKTVDVIWFNKERQMPSDLYEVEHSTDIKNSLSKFYELQDFFVKFFIVADKSREAEFNDKLSASVFDPIAKRVTFLSYDRVASHHENLSKAAAAGW